MMLNTLQLIKMSLPINLVFFFFKYKDRILVVNWIIKYNQVRQSITISLCNLFNENHTIDTFYSHKNFKCGIEHILIFKLQGIETVSESVGRLEKNKNICTYIFKIQCNIVFIFNSPRCFILCRQVLIDILFNITDPPSPPPPFMSLSSPTYSCY